MLNLFLPNQRVSSIFDIEASMLRKEGISAVLVDLDNTLVPWNVADATEEVRAWLSHLQQEQIKVMIFSNNHESRVKHFAEPLGMPYIYKARKPLPFSFMKATSKMGISTGQLAVIGDQLLTDILGGNRIGAYTILVQPIVQTDAPITQFNRRIESLILTYFVRKGKLPRSVLND